MTPKQFTRGFFYVIGALGSITLLYFVTEFVIRNWASLWDVFLIFAILGALYGFFRLFMWAFISDDKK